MNNKNQIGDKGDKGCDGKHSLFFLILFVIVIVNFKGDKGDKGCDGSLKFSFPMAFNYQFETFYETKSNRRQRRQRLRRFVQKILVQFQIILIF